MFAFRFSERVRIAAVAGFTLIAVFAVAVPVRAAEAPAVAAAARAAQAKRGTASLANGMPSAVAPQVHPGYASGFLLIPGAQPGMNIGGRVAVGKSHVYVPYYGNISNDPTHPGVQGTAGIAYGFRTWDISIFNGGFNTGQPAVPGTDPPKPNPSLSLSIRF